MLDFNERSTIDSRRLLYFYHVAKKGSLSRAEAALDAPQPAISRHISKLEDELGVKLLDRNGRGVTLTRYGEILLRHAETILGDMVTTVEEIEAARRQPSEQVRIAAPATMMSLYMPEVIRRFLPGNPQVELIALQALSGEIYTMLISDKIDVGIVDNVPNKAKFIEQTLLVEPLMAIVNKSHPLGSHASVKRELLAEQKLVIPSLAHGLRGTIDAYFHEGGVLTLNTPVQVDSIPLMRELVADGDFATILPRSTCVQAFDKEKFTIIALDPVVQRTLSVVRPRECKSPYAEPLCKHILDVVVERTTG